MREKLTGAALLVAGNVEDGGVDACGGCWRHYSGLPSAERRRRRAARLGEDDGVLDGELRFQKREGKTAGGAAVRRDRAVLDPR